mgnify:FL=1|tara:strand:- start:90 stop:317 length:228 start_codon:yes stop_codon:yes gene_type:complete
MIDKKIRDCLKKTFPKENVKKKITNLKIGSFKNWDSLAHLNLLILLEKSFKIKFSIEEMTSLKKISEIIKAIKNK